jgi:hypothetical protein
MYLVIERDGTVLKAETLSDEVKGGVEVGACQIIKINGCASPQAMVRDGRFNEIEAIDY